MKIKVDKREVEEIVLSHENANLLDMNPYVAVLVAGHVRHKQTIFSGMTSLRYFQPEDLKIEFARILLGEEVSNGSRIKDL